MPSRPHISSNTIHIRSAAASDIAFILSLAPRFVAFDLPQGRGKRETLAAIHTDIERALCEPPPDDHFFVSEDNGGNPTGFLHLQLQCDFFSGARACHISDLAVARAREGRGVGRALLAHAQAWAERHHCRRLTLSVFPGNTRARVLYERSGFDTDLIRMAKPLRKPR